MQPSIMESGRQPKISVILDDSDANEHFLKKFHCAICGKVVFEYYGWPYTIMAGGNELKDAKVIQCHGVITNYATGDRSRCKAQYTIQ